jgi:hypothetical protein
MLSCDLYGKTPLKSADRNSIKLGRSGHRSACHRRSRQVHGSEIERPVGLRQTCGEHHGRGSPAHASQHLLISVGQKVIKTFDSNQAESWKFYVCNNEERDRKSGSEGQHVYPTARLGCGHTEASK